MVCMSISLTPSYERAGARCITCSPATESGVCRRPDLVAGLAWVAPALPAQPDQWRRSLNVGQQLQQALRLALINNDRAGLHYIRRQLRKRAEEVQSGKLRVYPQDPSEDMAAVKEGYLKPMRVRTLCAELI